MDLNEPLGMLPKPASRRGLGLAIGAVVVVVAVGAASFVLSTADPRDGEPYAVVAVPPRELRPTPPAVAPQPQTGRPMEAAQPLDAERTGSIPDRVAVTRDPGHGLPETSDVENGVRVVRSAPRGTQPPVAAGPLIIDVSRALDDPYGRKTRGVATASVLAPAGVAPAGVGTTLSGASGPKAGVAPSSRPRVAIFVSGMGLSQTATRSALDTMPAEVTLAFVPYGAAIGATVDEAKTKGHEILLQIPMQNASGGPPGPHALRVGETKEALRADLAWLTSRFHGYDGVTNLLGAPVTADLPAMTALLTSVAADKLFYLDDGTSKRDISSNVAAGLGVPTLQADLVLDATPDAATVDANLERLLAIARRKGSAIGMASGLPDHMAAIAKFARDAGSKGVILVPVAALVGDKPADGMASVAK